MREALKVRVWDRYIVVPKLLGATFILISVIMLVYSSMQAFAAYDRVKDVRACVSSASTVAQYAVCVQKGMAAGVYVYTPKDFDPSNTAVPSDELWSAILPQIAWWFFWLAVFIVSIVVYRMGKLMIPVEEAVAYIPGTAVPPASGDTGDSVAAPSTAGKSGKKRRTSSGRTRKSSRTKSSKK